MLLLAEVQDMCCPASGRSDYRVRASKVAVRQGKALAMRRIIGFGSSGAKLTAHGSPPKAYKPLVTRNSRVGGQGWPREPYSVPRAERVPRTGAVSYWWAYVPGRYGSVVIRTSVAGAEPAGALRQPSRDLSDVHTRPSYAMLSILRSPAWAMIHAAT